MKLINTINGGVVEVDEDYAARLLKSTEWEQEKKPAPRSSRTKKSEEG